MKLEIGEYDYGARMYDPQLGRWHVVDPASEATYGGSPYMYVAGNPIKYIDLSGLIKYLAITMGSDVNYRGQNMASYDSEVEHHSLNNGITGLVSILQTASTADPEGIGFIALWSHGIPGEIFEGGNWTNNSITSDDLATLETSINNGDINFADGAIIYLGACNAGTDDGNGISFAQKLANITGAVVVAARNDQVGPKDESNGNLKYTTYYPQKNQFNWFENGQNPREAGSEADVMSLLDRAKNRTHPLEPLQPKTVNSVSWSEVMSTINSWLIQNPNIKVTVY